MKPDLNETKPSVISEDVLTLLEDKEIVELLTTKKTLLLRAIESLRAPDVVEGDDAVFVPTLSCAAASG